MFPSRLRTRVFSVLFSFLKWILSGSWSRHGVIFSKTLTYPACSSQVDLHWASPHLPWGMQRICGAFFFRIYLCLSRDFVNQHVFMLLDLHWDGPKLPWGMQRICGPFVLKTIIMPFKRFFVLWHSLIRSLYFIHFYIFIPLTHSAPFFRFSYILLYTNVFLCILPREIFFLFLMTLLLGILLLFFLISAVKGLIWTAFFFLTFIVLIQWNLPWNIVPTRPYLPTKLQCVLLLFDTSEILECAKVVVLKLGAILFYSGIHFKPLKLWKKKIYISRRSE